MRFLLVVTVNDVTF